MLIPYIPTLKTALFFTLTLIISISTLYEILEWMAVILFHPELGIAFLGTQGDVWDAQKDTIAAIIGALINIAFYTKYKQLLLLRTSQLS
jgi:putative membrane protein